VGGIWGQLSVGFFADPPTGPKGIFLGGGPNQLIVQAMAAVSITVWAAVATLLILWIVNNIIPIRLSPEDEIKGCDLTEHYLSKNWNNKVEMTTKKIEKVMEITTPIAHRFKGLTEDRNQRDSDNFGRRKRFHSNHGFDRGDEKL
jgi:Ammonium Transporter Family